MQNIAYHQNGAFTVIEINRKTLFLKRNDNGLWDLPGGGYDIDEMDYRKVATRETYEECGLTVGVKQLQLCAIVWQRLKKEAVEYYGGKIKFGTVYIHCSILYPETELELKLGNEHSEYRLFTHEEIIHEYKSFSSGPLWMYFTYLAYLQTRKVQEGWLADRSMWQGKEYK